MSLTETAGPTWSSSTSNTSTSSSYTPTANTLQVVVAAIGNGNNATTTGITVSDTASGTWTQLGFVMLVAADSSMAGVWCKDAGGSPAAQTITVTGASSGVDGTLPVCRQFAGAGPAASQTGVVASSGVPTTEPYTQAITPGTTGSQVVGAYGQSSNGVALTNNAATVMPSGYGTFNHTGNDTTAVFEASALSTGGTPITLGFTNSGTASGVFLLVEIIPATVTAAPVSAPTSIQPGSAWTAKFRRNLIRRIPAIPPSLATTLSIHVTDAGSAAETIAIATTLPDNGSAAETVSTAFTLADAGSAVETVSTKLTLPDTGTGADSLSIQIILSDTGSSAESLSAAFTLGDSGSAAETFTIMIMLADTGSSAETLPAATPVTDSGSAAEAITGIPPHLTDSGGGTETLAVTMPLPDSGSGTETLLSSASVTITDSGTGQDIARVTASIQAADTGAAQDSLARILTATDTGASAESIGIRFNAQLSEHQYNLDQVSVTGSFLPSAADSEHLTDTVRVTVKIRCSGSAGLLDTTAMTEQVILREPKVLTDKATRLETVESNIVCQWRIHTFVVQSFIAEWDVRKQVSQSVIVRWDISQILAVTLAVVFDVTQSVTAGPLIVEWYTGKAVQEYVPLVPRSAWRSTYPGNRSIPKSPWQSTYGK